MISDLFNIILIFNRLPKFKSEVKKVIRLPMPSFMVDKFPALLEGTIGGSYTHRQSEKVFSNHFSNAGLVSEDDLGSNIKRAQTLPPISRKQQAKRKKLHDVKFSSSFSSHQSRSGQCMVTKRLVMS